MNNEDIIKQFGAIASTILLAAQEKRMVNPLICMHSVRVCINSKANVCAVCRTRFDEPTNYGIKLMAPESQGFSLNPSYPSLMAADSYNTVSSTEEV